MSSTSSSTDDATSRKQLLESLVNFVVLVENSGGGAPKVEKEAVARALDKWDKDTWAKTKGDMAQYRTIWKAKMDKLTERLASPVPTPQQQQQPAPLPQPQPTAVLRTGLRDEMVTALRDALAATNRVQDPAMMETTIRKWDEDAWIISHGQAEQYRHVWKSKLAKLNDRLSGKPSSSSTSSSIPAPTREAMVATLRSVLVEVRGDKEDDIINRSIEKWDRETWAKHNGNIDAYARSWNEKIQQLKHFDSSKPKRQMLAALRDAMIRLETLKMGTAMDKDHVLRSVTRWDEDTTNKSQGNMTQYVERWKLAMEHIKRNTETAQQNRAAAAISQQQAAAPASRSISPLPPSIVPAAAAVVEESITKPQVNATTTSSNGGGGGSGPTTAAPTIPVAPPPPVTTTTSQPQQPSNRPVQPQSRTPPWDLLIAASSSLEPATRSFAISVAVEVKALTRCFNYCERLGLQSEAVISKENGDFKPMTDRMVKLVQTLRATGVGNANEATTMEELTAIFASIRTIQTRLMNKYGFLRFHDVFDKDAGLGFVDHCFSVATPNKEVQAITRGVREVARRALLVMETKRTIKKSEPEGAKRQRLETT